MKKLLDLTPELLVDEGDCQTLCLRKIFNYYNIEGFEKILFNYYYLQFEDNEMFINDDEIETYYKLSFFSYKNIPTLLKNNYNIGYNSVANISQDKIFKLIDNDIPVLMKMSGVFLSWTKQTIESYHFFIIIGYNTVDNTFICIDPYYSKDYLFMPFDILNNAKKSLYFPSIYLYEYQKFQNQKPFHIDIKQEFNHIFNSVKNNPVSQVLNKVNNIIVSNIPYLTIDNFGYYTLSPNELLRLTFRFSSLSTYFNYISSKCPMSWLDEIALLYKNSYYCAKECLEFFIKISLSRKEDEISLYINKIAMFENNENKIESLLKNNIEKSINERKITIGD